MDKKKVIVTLCKKFPAAHPKAGNPTGFEEKLKSGAKIHTIRYNAKGVWDERYKGLDDYLWEKVKSKTKEYRN